MNKRILVVENNLFILEVIGDLLTRFGYLVERAQTGKEALEQMEQGAFDAILLDIHLFDLDGKVVYSTLKERSPALAKRVIFVTGDLGNKETASFIKASGNLCLEKPFTLNQIKELMERFFQDEEGIV